VKYAFLAKIPDVPVQFPDPIATYYFSNTKNSINFAS
jgi:hypothetical protein